MILILFGIVVLILGMAVVHEAKSPPIIYWGFLVMSVGALIAVYNIFANFVNNVR